MDGHEKSILKDAIRSLYGDGVESKQAKQSKILKRAAKLAKERGIVKSKKKAQQHFESFRKTERYIQRHVEKLLGKEYRASLVQNASKSVESAVKNETIDVDRVEQLPKQSHAAGADSKAIHHDPNQGSKPAKAENAATAHGEKEQSNKTEIATEIKRVGKKRKKGGLLEPAPSSPSQEAEAGVHMTEGPQKKKKKKRTRSEEGTQKSATEAKLDKNQPRNGARQQQAADPNGLFVARSQWRVDTKRTDVKVGPFSRAEDEALLEAARLYAHMHDIPEGDLSWVVHFHNTKKAAKQSHHCAALAEIGAALPYRKLFAIRARLQRLTHPGNNRGLWTEQEKALLLELYAKYGGAWTKMAEHLDRMPLACRDKARELTLCLNRNTGKWSKEEEKNLVAACTKQTQQNAANGKTTYRGIHRVGNTRDGIDWELVCKDVGTRSPVQCSKKWYEKLRPSMREQGMWGDGQDHELLQSLWERKPLSEVHVAWGNLVQGRDSSTTKDRWLLMRSCIRCFREFEFNQQILYLAAKYKPKLLMDADESGPYRVSQHALKQAMAAKAAGDTGTLDEVAREIASFSHLP